MASAAQGHNAARLTPQVRVTTDHSSTASSEEERVRFQISNLDFFYGAKQASVRRQSENSHPTKSPR